VTLRDEILEQPAAAERQLASSRPAIDALVARLRAEPIDHVVIAARGTSDHAAVYAQYLLGTVHRLPVALATPSILSLYGVVPRFARALVVGISQSGASPDVVGVVDAGRRQHVPTLAITNDPDSPLAKAAEYVIALAAEPERAVAATKTYTTSLLAIARLSAELLDEADSRAAVTAIPDALAQALTVEPEVERIADELAAADRCLVLGRGYEYATAREWALKLKELTHLLADPYSGADFQHGPIGLVHDGFPILAVATAGPALDGMVELLARVRDAGARLLVLSDEESVLALGEGAPLPAVPEWLSPLVAIIPAQLFAYHLARARGLDTEAPRNLAKVTLTL